jgi:hypothetical protein
LFFGYVPAHVIEVSGEYGKPTSVDRPRFMLALGSAQYARDLSDRIGGIARNYACLPRD